MSSTPRTPQYAMLTYSDVAYNNGIHNYALYTANKKETLMGL